MKEKNVYNVPEIKVVFLDDADVIATSQQIPDDDGYSQYYPDPILP